MGCGVWYIKRPFVSKWSFSRFRTQQLVFTISAHPGKLPAEYKEAASFETTSGNSYVISDH